MPSSRLRFAGLELFAAAHPENLKVGASLSNGAWRTLYTAVRERVHGGREPSDPNPAASIPVPPDASPEQRELLDRVSKIAWYHSIDLGNSVVTPGYFNHRPYLPLYCLPERLDGLRVLDVATWDGFWAFEFEKRGAREVVAIDVETPGDVDLPPRARAKLTAEELNRPLGRGGFELARDALGSKVRREILSVYDLSPASLGEFDIVHCGDLLVHLMNPVKALQNIASVTIGYALISECVFPELTWLGSAVLEYRGGADDCNWWRFSSEGLARMIEDAGFDQIELLNTFRNSRRGLPASTHHAVIRASHPL